VKLSEAVLPVPDALPQKPGLIRSDPRTCPFPLMSAFGPLIDEFCTVLHGRGRGRSIITVNNNRSGSVWLPALANLPVLGPVGPVATKGMDRSCPSQNLAAV
jgi:hypothetical protein